uniref:hypothetical protein n=1 Tax=Flavobacterium sp. TaxID=239 RepID=UPI0037C0CCC9
MGRLCNDEKKIGKWFSYGTTSSSDNLYQILYSTDVDEDERSGHNTLTIYFRKFICRLTLLEFVKPYQVKVQASWDEATVKRLGRDHYFLYFDYEYGFRISYDFAQLFYGLQGDGHYGFPSNLKEKRKSAFIPWNSYRHIRHEVYDCDNQLVYEEKQDKNNREDWDLQYKATQACKKKTFKVRDHDGEEVLIDTHIEVREWKRGEGWFKWLSFFMKGIYRRTMELSIRTELGNRKDTWKGGIRGMG